MFIDAVREDMAVAEVMEKIGPNGDGELAVAPNDRRSRKKNNRKYRCYITALAYADIISLYLCLYVTQLHGPAFAPSRNQTGWSLYCMKYWMCPISWCVVNSHS